MASLLIYNGLAQIQLRVGASRHTIRLGRISRRLADVVKTRVESLALAHELGVDPDVETAAWLARVDDKLHRKLVRAGLAGGRARVDVTLGELTDTFLVDWNAGGKQTRANLRGAFNRLIGHFGADRPARSITVRDAEEWRAAMVTGEYSEATIATDVKKARQLWTSAMKSNIVDANPWAEIAAGDMANPDRGRYVPRAVIAAVMEHAPDDEFRLIVALSRFAGLRFCSEHYALRVADIDFPRSRFTVRGKGRRDRVVPIFDALRPYLETIIARLVRDGRPADTHVIGRDRRVKVSRTAVRKEFLAALKRAGISPWPRLFHNLRASLETDLARDGYAPHVYTAWLGNSEAVARKHYLKVTEDDFDRAAGEISPKKKVKSAT